MPLSCGKSQTCRTRIDTSPAHHTPPLSLPPPPPSPHVRFQFHAHTVDLVYQSSLLHTREELAMVTVGPLTLNAATFLLVLIRWGCQQIFGSLPSFTSKFIMVQGVWTVLDPLAVLAVDAVLGVSHLKITWTLVHFK